MKINKKNKILCVLPKYFYGDKKRGLSIEYKFLYQILKKNFEKTFYFNSYNLNFDVFKINNNLIKFAKNIKPDFIFLHQAHYEIFQETLFYLKNQLNVKIINWCSDDSWRYKEFTKLISDPIDVLITTDSCCHKLNKNNKQGSILSNWGILKNDLIRPKKFNNNKKKISFIGTNYMKRNKWISKLNENGVAVDCYGYGWKSRKVTEKNYNRIVNNSYISLNFSESRNNILQTKARIFEITGSGSLCLTQKSTDVQKYFKNNKEIICFDTIEDLLKKIKFIYKNLNLRNKIAMNGFNKCKNYFTYERNISIIIDKLKKIRPKKIKMNKQNSKLYLLINFSLIFLLKSLIKIFLSLGASKKFLKRLLFEIEWRLHGNKTYSKNGWTVNCFPIL
jgi:hypothetical protein